MKKVQIIDAIMGSGKTYDAIARMKKHRGSFIYVTPFLNEVERVINEVPKARQPIVTSTTNSNGDKTVNYKRDNLLTMAFSGVNLVTTHTLFSTLHRDNYKSFKKYDLILDEVLTPIKVLDMKADDIKLAINQGLIITDNNTGEVTYVSDSYQGDYYKQLRKYCATSNVIYLNGKLLVWAFPPEIFKSFKTITVLTYLFEGSLLAAYFKYYNIPYAPPITDKLKERKIKNKISKLLTIYEGSKNNIGSRSNAFSKTWLSNKTRDELSKISKSAVNLIKHTYKTKAGFNAYTTFKIFKYNLRGNGFAKGFISVNERATNQYSDTKTMIYFANRYLNPNTIEFFRVGGVKVDEEQWALGELLQWIWRGCIRNDEPMNLFIPSKRMRELLKDWLNN